MKQNYNTHFMAAIVTLHETSDPQLNKSRMKILFCCTLLVLGLLTSITATAQQGYIYVHKQALDESSSVNSTFTVTGGSTSVTPFQLNDQSAQVNIAEFGSSQNGRLWAVDVNDKLYYRNSGSSQWVLTNVTAKKVDGGPGGDCYFIDGGSRVFRFDGTTATKIGDPLSGSNWGNGIGLLNGDIGNGWDGNPYIITDQGIIFRYTGIWVKLQPNASTDNHALDGFVDGSGSIVVAKNDGNIYKLTSAGGVETNLGRPANTSGTAYDVAVDDQGNIYAIYVATNGNAGSSYVYKWVSGTTWTTFENTSKLGVRITGGLGKQLWMVNGYSAFQNIYARSMDGSNIKWIEDEMVRTSPTGNSAMIGLAPGTYTITETVPSGWDLYDITVNDPTSNSSKNIQSNTATLVVGAGETVNVIFQSGLLNTTTMASVCGVAGQYKETFGTGTVCTYGTPLVGQTSYHFENNATSDFPDGGYYTVLGNTLKCHSGSHDLTLWANLNDHTAGDGTGRMMLVNPNDGSAPFFRRRFDGVIVGRTYTFSAWIANVTKVTTNPPNVAFEVVDPATMSVVKSNSTGNIPWGVWTKYSITFTATTTTVDLVLRNNAPGGGGNDLALDDISFQLNCLADLSIKKTGPNGVIPNAALSYNLVITNNGPDAADGAIIKDLVVPNFTADTVTCGTATGGAACPILPYLTQLQGSGMVIPTLPSGGSITLTIPGNAGASGKITNIATVSPPAGTTDSTSSNNSSTAITQIGCEPFSITASGGNSQNTYKTDGSITITGFTPGHTYLISYNFNGTVQSGVTYQADAAGKIMITGFTKGVYDAFNIKNDTGCSTGAFSGVAVSLTN